MGWKGTIRSINAAVNQAERDAKRRQRDLERNLKQQYKMQELQQAAYEVEVFENHLEIVQSMHKECSNPLNWKEIALSSEPEKPIYSDELECEALLNKENYKPSLIDRIFKRTEKKLAVFSDAICTAKDKDKLSYDSAISQWERDRSDWADSVSQAKLLLSGNADARIQTIKELNPFTEISALGSNLEFSVDNEGILTVTINIHGEEIIPKEQKSLLKSGKLSIKKMPVGKFNEIYQDYVCSSVLRAAREIFSILPDEYVVVNAQDLLLNKSTGHLEQQIILSVYIPRSTLLMLNMDLIDPSDSMQNFVHNMSFKKTKGFEPVCSVNIG
ncbi:hypothetical protein RND59_06715 [Vibrio ruber]|uniref:hypothetical protein n=1 Tax=Vibrio ruber TaxID=184755 RepID=UPI002893342B|nr:hypothetical protein [Vibrio ruber]WNJ96763.1 hypothetical protein RND59_06715 [Vibrio ruber]